MSKKASLVWTDTCKGKLFYGSERVICAKYVPKGQKLCDYHLLEKFDLSAIYDSEDGEGLSPMYDEKAVLLALREATKL